MDNIAPGYQKSNKCTQNFRKLQKNPQISHNFQEQVLLDSRGRKNDNGIMEK